MVSVLSSRRGSSAALLLLLVAIPAAHTSVFAAVPAAGVLASDADVVAAPSEWPRLQALYEGGLSADPVDPHQAVLATAQDVAPMGTPAPAKGPGKKAMLYSLLLPGMGELSMGETGRATGFFIAEGLIWTNFIYWTVSGNLRQDDYVEQANLNAGVGVSKESDDYWKLVGQYQSSSGSGSGSYEETLRREARDVYPDDPAAQDAYVAQKLPTGDRAWEWSSSTLQDTYISTRNSSSHAYNHAQYSYAAAILNRVLSVIDVQLLRHKASKAAVSGLTAPDYRLYADTAADGTGRVVLQRRF